MMSRVLLAFLGLSLAFAQELNDPIAVNFDCSSMVPVGASLEDQQPDGAFSISISKTDFLPGEEIVVTIAKNDDQIQLHSFMVQARTAEGTPMGVWLFDASDPFRAFSCGQTGRADTIMVAARERGTPAEDHDSVVLTWQAPLQAGSGKLDFQAALVTEDLKDGELVVRKFWIMRSVQIVEVIPGPEAEDGGLHNPQSEAESETRHEISDETGEMPVQEEGQEGTGEDPNGAERQAQADRDQTLFMDTAHNGQSEAQLQQQQEEKKQQEIEEELKESEGEWTVREAREKAEHEEQIHQEMMLHEKALEEEERERQERIRMEILDKENYERQRAEEEAAAARTTPKLEDEIKEIEEHIDEKIDEVEDKIDEGVDEIDIDDVFPGRDGDKVGAAPGLSMGFFASLFSLLLAFFL